ncbi:MAG: hypothetical protein ACLFM0_09805 [Spirochaetales bacterium]
MRLLLSVLVGALIAVPAVSQTADRIDEVLDHDELTAGDAAYIAAASGSLVADTADAEEALAALSEAGFPADAVAADEPVRLDEFAYMLMLSHERPGGLFYTLFPGPRYAFRELEYERVIRGGGDPNDTITPSRGINLVTRLTNITDAEG